MGYANSEEYHQQALEIKKEIYVKQLVQKVVEGNCITLSDAELEQIFQECLAWVNAQELYSSAIVYEVQK